MAKQIKKRPLRTQIEVEVERPAAPSGADYMDPAIGDYIGSLMNDISALGPLQKMDLTTVEGAQAAIKQTESTLNKLKQHQRTVSALQSLLNSRSKS